MDNVVAIEIDNDTSQGTVWQRLNGEVVSHEVPFRPWLVSSFLNKQHGAKTSKLSGDHQIKWFHSYPTIDDYMKGKHIHPWGKAFMLEDMRQQFLAINRDKMLFQNMRFDQLNRFVFDIETEDLDPTTNRILMITISCEWGDLIIEQDSEEDMIDEMEVIIQAINPDTIEGYNIYGFDIPFLLERAAQYGKTLNWGRNGEPVELGKKWNFRVGSYDQPVQTHNVYGRHVIDGLIVAKRYDANTQGTFENFQLKYLTKKLGISKDDRVYLDRNKMKELYINDPDLVRKYAMQDASETKELIAMMVQPEFYLTTMIPDTFQNVLMSGNSTKINVLLVGEYLEEQHSIPLPSGEREDYEGGYVDCRLFGVFENVAKADVASLYPSIMLNKDGATPNQDTLGVFKNTLAGLTTKRLAIKKQEQQTTDPNEKQYLHGLNWAYKITINSFYGYLAVKGMHFSDHKAAATVTRVGREIVTDMADQMEAMGMTIIEIDTDGVYFQHPEGCEIVELIPQFLSLEDWVTVEVEDRYDAMISIKAKNYVLKKVGKDELSYHGNSLRSRRDEKFGRAFLDSVVGKLLSGKMGEIAQLYVEQQRRILQHGFTKDEITKRERISSATFKSPTKAKIRAAIEGKNLKEGDYIYIYQSVDGSYKLIDNYKRGDADTFYYLERLHKFGQRLESVLEVYDIQLPRMTKKEYYVAAGIEPPKRQKKEVVKV
jgi:DNA polymerase I